MDAEMYQLMLDDLGQLVDLFGLPLGKMMNQSPRQVLLNCITEARKNKEALEAEQREIERLRAALRAVMDEITSSHNYEAYEMYKIAEAALTQEPDC